MCGVFEHSNSVPCQNHDDTVPDESLKIATHDKFGLSKGDTDDLFSSLLEFAASDDLTGFKHAVESSVKVDAVGSWYSRQNGLNRMALEQRTPVMVASLYGSVDVLSYILNCYKTCGGDINRSCGSDGSTALHCAAAGGASRAVDIINLLLNSGADLDALDAQGLRPADVITASPKYPRVKSLLETILKKSPLANGSLPVTVPPRVSELEESTSYVSGDVCLPVSIFETLDEFHGLVAESGSREVDAASTGLLSSTCSSPEELSPAFSSPSPSSSPKSTDSNVAKALRDGVDKSREYPVDPSVPDIKNSIYTTDEFRMFSFKVRPCSRAYSHDWTECPFVHPGENARRRDPRRYHYSCVPCPDFRKGACRRGDACEYAHGVFECWLHPAQYRTRLCKDGTSCTRRVCFFAHTTEELRPLYVSSGSTVVSPRTSSLDMSLSPLSPGSPSPLPVLMIPAFSPSNPGQSGLSTPPMSPSSTGTNSLGGTWQQPNVPTLHLPGVGLHASRLRASLSARDLPYEDISELDDFAGQLMGDFTPMSTAPLSTHARLNAAVAASSCGSSSRAGKYRNVGLSVSPTNLEELFASEMVLSPRNAVHESAFLSQIGAQLQSHKSTQVHSQLQNTLQSQINSHVLPQVPAQTQLQIQHSAIDSQIQGHAVLQSSPQSSSLNVGSINRVSSLSLDADHQNSSGVLQSPSQSCYSLGSLGHISSSLGLDLALQSDSGALLSPAAVAARAAFAQREKHSSSSQDLGAGLTWSDWGSPTGKPEWGVQKDDLCKFRKSASFGFRGSEDPDFSWVQKLAKGPLDTDSSTSVCSAQGSVTANGSRDIVDHSVLGSWIEEMHLDQIVT